MAWIRIDGGSWTTGQATGSTGLTLAPVEPFPCPRQPRAFRKATSEASVQGLTRSRKAMKES